jgi:hypothetical protein
MGSTLEEQKKKAPKPKPREKKVVVTPDKPFYSSESLRKGFVQRLPSAVYSAQMRRSILPPRGRSPKASAWDVVAGAMDLFRGEEGKRGSRYAEMAAPKLVERES